MTDHELPAGLVLWPDDAKVGRRIAVLISDIHCTDGSVGKQTADETDWKNFFKELGEMLDDPENKPGEVLLILNGDVVDLLRSGKWAEKNVYPWQRNNPRFEETVIEIMRGIFKKHACDPKEPTEKCDSGNTEEKCDSCDSCGFFCHLKRMVKYLRTKGLSVTIIPIVGNHDKELQVVPEARVMYYQKCLGLSEADLSASYRNWVAAQMGADPGDSWPVLPFYVAYPRLRLFVTHGQWRDEINSHVSRYWRFCKEWQPQNWQKDQYRVFSDSCFGDTIASGLLSHFIWKATKAIKESVMPRAKKLHQAEEEIEHILNVLNEMDLYRPSAQAIVCLLEEARKIDQRDESTQQLYQTLIDQYRNSLHSWLSHPETFSTAPWPDIYGVYVISVLSRLKCDSMDIHLMKFMAWMSDIKKKTPFVKLPAFLKDYRSLGFRLHAEGHTHVTMDVDLRFTPPREHRNYTYVNLGAWRNRIVPKYENMGYRRLSVGRALIVHGSASSDSADDDYWLALRDIIIRGDILDRW